MKNLIIVNSISKVRKIIKNWKKENCNIGFVPTMGYLHEGHLSLIKKAKQENDKVVVSIFVNPLQFSPNEDYATYPQDIEKDKKLSQEAGADLIFYPQREEMYPKKNPLVYIDVIELDNNLCGAKRKGHFKGACTVVGKLFNIITPQKTYFGKKDAQQTVIIKKMIEDLNYDIEIVPCEIIREKDGLAKSSRNIYLNEQERKAAIILFQTLNLIKDKIENKKEYNVINLINFAKKNISKENLAKIDYVEIVDANNLQKINIIKGEVLIALAVYIGKTRLIDNFSFNV